MTVSLSFSAWGKGLFEYLPPEAELLEREYSQRESVENFVEERGDGPEDFKSLDARLNKDLYLAAGYQQPYYMLKDIQGDVALLHFARTNMLRIKLMLKKDEAGIRDLVALQRDGFERYKELYPQWDFGTLVEAPLDTTLTEARIAGLPISDESKALVRQHWLNQNVGFELRSRPFKAAKVTRMLLQVIREEHDQHGIVPKSGEEHRFAPEIFKYYRQEYPILKTGMTKLFMALGNGLTSRFLVTGTERELVEELEAREFESVDLAEAFRLSYRLNQGDLYLTILALENVFAYHWNTPARDRSSVLQRLRPFTHFFNRGDKFGHWYHFWGMVLYGHQRSSTRAALVGGIEELLSRLAGGEDDQENQEGLVNIHAGIVGGRLRRAVARGEHLRMRPDPAYTRESYYLEPMKLDDAIKKRLAPR